MKLRFRIRFKPIYFVALLCLCSSFFSMIINCSLFCRSTAIASLLTGTSSMSTAATYLLIFFLQMLLQVQGTNDHSIVSKLSMAERGYLEDPFLKCFVKGDKIPKRSSLINRGYYIRSKVVRSVIQSFIQGIMNLFKISPSVGLRVCMHLFLYSLLHYFRFIS